MDDFLHNLRSGKLKQQSGGNRPYNDPQYKGAARRNQMDRRNKSHHDNKESSERLNAIKEVLENLERTQKKMAEAYAARTRAEERKARAMEVLAKNLYKMLNPNAKDADQLFALEPAANANHTEISPVEGPGAADDRSEEGINAKEGTFSDGDMFTEDDMQDTDAAGTEDDSQEAQGGEEEESRPRARLTEVDRHTLYAIINQMREDGEGWEKIARHIASQGYPTISGKGNWRGVMVKTLFEKMGEQ